MKKSAAKTSLRVIQGKKETPMDKTEDKPDEDWSVGGNIGQHLVL
jgi:hypothetical protein